MNPTSLVRLRILSGCSQAELSRRSGLAQGHISELERGVKAARPETIKKLAVGLAVPMQALLDNDVLPEPENGSQSGETTS